MTKIEKIQLLFQVSRVGEQTAESFNKLTNQLNDKLEKLEGDDPMKGALEHLKEKFQERYEKMREEQIRIYDKYLTEDTIDAALAFFKTDGGQSYSDNIPKIKDEIVKVADGLAIKLASDMLLYFIKSGHFGSGNMPGFMAGMPGGSEFGYGSVPGVDNDVTDEDLKDVDDFLKNFNIKLPPEEGEDKPKE